jgi:AcrR family transcriptional regulator
MPQSAHRDPRFAPPLSATDLTADLDQLGLRARQRLERTSAIEHAAIALVAEHGLDSVSNDQIALAAGVSTRTVLRYFPGGRDQILLGQVQRTFDGTLTAMRRRPPQETAIQALHHALLDFAQTCDLDRSAVRTHAEMIRATPALAMASAGQQSEHTAALIREVSVRLGADPTSDPVPSFIVVTMLAVTHLALERWLQSEDRSYPDVVAEALDLLGGGLNALEGYRGAQAPPSRPDRAR